MRILVALAIVGALGSHARAGKPIAWTMKGCVAGGVFYQIDRGGAARVNLAKPLDVGKLEGKFIAVAGWLNVGDYFTTGDKPPVVTRDCTAADRLAIEYAKAHELRMQAARLPDDKLDEAIALVEASIALVTPAECDTYIDRAHLYARKDDLKSAERDLAILEKRTCRFGGLLNWLLLQELGNELRTRADPKAAVRALALARANCDADICRPGIEKDLATAKAAAAKK